MNRLDLAIYDAVHAFGARPLAERMHLQPQELINKVTPGLEAHYLTLDQFLIVLEATKSKEILAALKKHVGINDTDASANNLMLVVLAAAKGASDVLSVFQKDALEGNWSMRDAKRLEAEGNAAVAAIAHAIAASYALAKSGGALEQVVA